MFRKFIATAVVALSLGVSATSASAAVTPVLPTYSEVNAVAYGPHWILNNFKDYSYQNNLASVFNDLGADRTWFRISAVNVSLPSSYGEDLVVTIKNDKGQYLSQWSNQNPAVNGWRARWDWVNGNVIDVPAVQWILVPNGSYYNLVDVSSINNSDGPYALTIAQGGSTKETNGVPDWSDLVLLPLSQTDKFQLFNFVNPSAQFPAPTGTSSD